MKIPHAFLLVLVLVPVLAVALAAAAQAGDDASRYWPQWRGPLHDGTSPHGDPPSRWREGENVRFKVAVPGRGLSSPVVWGDTIYLLTAVAGDAEAYAASQQRAAEKQARQEWPPSVDPVPQRFVVLALSRHDGSLKWQRTAVEKVPHESHYIDSSWASASALTDGRRVFAFFGSNGLFAYDVDGTLLWQRDLGDMETRNGFGEGSSPALHGDTLVVNWDHEGDSFIVALDAASGEERWRKARPDEVTSWATPLVVEHGGKAQAIVPATGKSRGYDLATGEELWQLAGMTVNTIPTPVARDGVVYLMSGYRGTMLQAVDLAKARGELAGDHPAVRWTYEKDTPYVPSPLLYDGTLYFLKHLKGIWSALDAATGAPRYPTVRLPVANVWASPVAAAGRIYVVGRDGTTVVLAAGDRFEVLAENPLDDRFDASPAIVGDTIYLRGYQHLYGIAATAAGKAGEKADEKATAAATGR